MGDSKNFNDNVLEIYSKENSHYFECLNQSKNKERSNSSQNKEK